MSIVKRLRDHLDSRQVKYVVISHSQAFTAQEIAASLHVPGRELAKTVVLKTEKGLALAVMRAMDKVDLDRAREALGDDTRIATEQEFGGVFPDCEVGAMPPFGRLYDLPVYVDACFPRGEAFVFQAGSHREVIRMRYADFERLAQPVIGEFCLHAREKQVNE